MTMSIVTNGLATMGLVQSPLAIVGMACRLPGADGLQAYWNLLREGGSAVDELPPDRLDRELYYDPRKGVRGKTYSSLGGLIPCRPLDYEVCPLPETLLRSSDPAHLILCEVAAAACRDAGYDPFKLPLRNAGVYVGHSGGSPLPTDLACATMAEHSADQLRDVAAFRQLPADQQEDVIQALVKQVRREKPRRDADGGPDLEANAAASLIARAFGLSGPQMVLDAACASSLVALGLASMALSRGVVDMALVGGASFCKSSSLILFSQAQSCSATGSRPFDAQADGLISSEGYVVLMVKTLDRALADCDTVHAVIRGIGISTDGRGRSLWAPRKEGQTEAVRRAYGPELKPSDVQYIETHATSTQVGDATEVEALAAFFSDHLPAGRKIPIGSVKSNIGHSLETAGLAGLLKVVLAMRAREIPASIQVRELNREVDWQHVPFEVATIRKPWPEPVAGQSRMAAVNAFGIGGLNVHVVLTEPTAVLSNRQSHHRRAVPVTGGPRQTEEPVAIIGRGVVLPGAQSVPEFWQLLASGRDATSDVAPDRWKAALGHRPGKRGPWYSPTTRGGFIRDYVYDWQAHNIPPKQIANANPLQFMLLDAADQALSEAGYDQRPFDRRRTAVIVGTVFGGDFGSQLEVGLSCPELERSLATVLNALGISAVQSERITAELRDLVCARLLLCTIKPGVSPAAHWPRGFPKRST